MKQHEQRLKMKLVLPLLVIPFLTMGFWALGGGKGRNVTNKDSNGMNLHLPQANLKDDKAMDKLAFYDKADKDSLKRAEYMRSDPYYKDDAASLLPVASELEDLTENTASKFKQRLATSPYEETTVSPETKVMNKLALLEKEMNKPAEPGKENYAAGYREREDDFSSQVDRLESMMAMMNNNNGEDPEMKQVDGTLDKILDIQHPGRVSERLKEKSVQQKGIVFPVSSTGKDENISLLDTAQQKEVVSAGFYGVEDAPAEIIDDNAIEAVVHENQTLVNGAVIKFRLLRDIFINGSLIPRGNFVFGFVSLHEERLEVEVSSIRYQQSLFPVKLEVFDMDGLAGIYIPGAITRDVAKQSTDNSLQLMELTSADPSLKAQAAAAGVSTAKSLLSKKVKLVKVMVKAGYKVLLKDKNAVQ